MSFNCSKTCENIFLDKNNIDLWSLFNKNIVDNEYINSISYEKIIDPINRKNLINYFRTDSYLNYKNIDLIKNEIHYSIQLMNAKPYKVFVLDLDKLCGMEL